MTRETAVKLFESKKVRSVWENKKGKWYFSIVDVVEILTDDEYRSLQSYLIARPDAGVLLRGGNRQIRHH